MNGHVGARALVTQDDTSLALSSAGQTTDSTGRASVTQRTIRVKEQVKMSMARKSTKKSNVYLLLSVFFGDVFCLLEAPALFFQWVSDINGALLHWPPHNGPLCAGDLQPSELQLLGIYVHLQETMLLSHSPVQQVLVVLSASKSCQAECILDHFPASYALTSQFSSNHGIIMFCHSVFFVLFI